MKTWRELVDEHRKGNGDLTPIAIWAPDEAVADVPFDTGYGGENGQPFLAWSEEFVYFPVCYDGAEWAGSAPRYPRKDGQEHVGGG